MKAIEFLKQHRVYEDETIYNSVGEIVGTISQLMEDYASLRKKDVSGALCGYFEPDNRTSSATKCKCGREKWEHPKPRN